MFAFLSCLDRTLHYSYLAIIMMILISLAGSLACYSIIPLTKNFLVSALPIVMIAYGFNHSYFKWYKQTIIGDQRFKRLIANTTFFMVIPVMAVILIIEINFQQKIFLAYLYFVSLIIWLRRLIIAKYLHRKILKPFSMN